MTNRRPPATQATMTPRLRLQCVWASSRTGREGLLTHPGGDARPVKSLSLLPLLLLLLVLLFPTLAPGAPGLLSEAGADRTKDDDPAAIAVPIPKTSRGFLASSETARLAMRDAVPVPVPVPVPLFRRDEGLVVTQPYNLVCHPGVRQKRRDTSVISVREIWKQFVLRLALSLPSAKDAIQAVYISAQQQRCGRRRHKKYKWGVAEPFFQTPGDLLLVSLHVMPALGLERVVANQKHVRENQHVTLTRVGRHGQAHSKRNGCGRSQLRQIWCDTEVIYSALVVLQAVCVPLSKTQNKNTALTIKTTRIPHPRLQALAHTHRRPSQKKCSCSDQTKKKTVQQ